MDLNTLGNFISQIGFPIACCCFLFYQQYKQNQYNQERDNALKESINSNTKPIQSLERKIDKIK